jgi:hypothetical protein
MLPSTEGTAFLLTDLLTYNQPSRRNYIRDHMKLLLKNCLQSDFFIASNIFEK